MTIKEIENLVNERKNELLNNNKKKVDINIVKEIINNNKIKKLTDITNIKIWELLECYYYLEYYNTKSLEEIIIEFNDFEELLNNLGYESYTTILDIFLDEIDVKQLPLLADYYDDNLNAKEKFDLRNNLNIDNESYTCLMRLKELQDKEDFKVSTLLRLISNNKSFMDKILFLFSIKRNLELQLEVIKEELSKVDHISESEKNKITTEYISEKYNTREIIKLFNNIRRKVQDEERTIKEYENKKKFEIRELDTMIYILKRESKNKEITNTKEIIKHIEDNKIKIEVLKYIIEHNTPYQKKLKKKLKNLETNQNLQYKALLKDYNINDQNYNIKKIMNNTLKDVENILIELKKYNYTENIIIYILEHSNINRIIDINILIDKGILNREFIENNKKIFNIKSNNYNIIINNINTISNYSINPQLFINNNEVLLTNNNIIKYNLDICNSYNLLKLFKNNINYKFLLDSNLCNKIDKLVELDYYNYIVDDINILNYNGIDRLELLKVLNINIDNIDNLKNIIDTNNKFFIKDNMIEEYIPDILSIIDDIDISNDIILDLDSNQLTYNIGGVNVSRNKIIRLINEGYCLVDAIFYNLKLSLEEYENMKNDLMNNDLMKIKK